jgi:cysteinyl-tRNA synthetase
MRILRLRNSLSNEIENINIDPKKEIKIYLCGPTVYDDVHIGNMRPSIIFDIIIRVLNEIEVKVKYIQNITDIDDKIVERSKKEGKSEISISLKYTKIYLENFENINLITPEFQAVTLNIKSVIDFVEILVKNGNGYLQGENILFDIKKNKENYGKLSNQILTKLSRENGRDLSIIEKKDEKDFVLWKKTSDGINWKTKWFKGRPGWHTECVTLVDKFFNKETIDIHGGGKDLLFPHHENERIQYWAVNKKELSKIWIHFGHVKIQEEKMSKSLGNQISTKEFIKKHGGNVLRFLILNSNYNEDIQVSKELIKQSKTQIKKIENVLKKIGFFFIYNKKKLVDYDEINNEVIELLLNNLETIKVFFILEEYISFINKEIENYNDSKKEQIENKIKKLIFILKIMGFDFKINYYSEKKFKLISDWKELISKKEFKKADKLRAFLQKKFLL